MRGEAGHRCGPPPRAGGSRLRSRMRWFPWSGVALPGDDLVLLAVERGHQLEGELPLHGLLEELQSLPLLGLEVLGHFRVDADQDLLPAPVRLQVGQDVQNRDCRSWRTRLRVISTSPSSEISRTLVRALSSPSAFWRAWRTCWRWSSRSMSLKSMMMIPPRSRRRIWRTASPTASRLILRMVCSKSRLPTYLPVFTSMATRASVWSMTM